MVHGGAERALGVTSSLPHRSAPDSSPRSAPPSITMRRATAKSRIQNNISVRHKQQAWPIRTYARSAALRAAPGRDRLHSVETTHPAPEPQIMIWGTLFHGGGPGHGLWLGNLGPVDHPQPGAVGLAAQHQDAHACVVGRAGRVQRQVFEPDCGQRRLKRKPTREY
jgi:hypothetical protein